MVGGGGGGGVPHKFPHQPEGRKHGKRGDVLQGMQGSL